MCIRDSTYSERANTTAVRMEDIVPMEVRRERTKQLRILGSKLQRAHYERHQDTTRSVLFESENLDEHMLGYTDNYIRVSAPFDASLANVIVGAALGRINGDGHMEASLTPARHGALTSTDHLIDHII